MSNDFDRVLSRLESLTVGFGPLFRDFSGNFSTSYPPHNIISDSDNELFIEMAVAGFKKDEISIEEKKGILTVTGEKKTGLEPESYRYRGIAARNFTKQFRVAEFYEISDAKLEDGILTIHFVKNEPEEEKPKLISIK